MRGGSGRPRRRKAAGASLRYERARGRTAASAAPDERERRFSRRQMRRWAGGWAAVAAIIGPFVIAQVWGPDIWSGIAPGWPGGGYGFAVSAGVLLPWGPPP